MTRYAGRNPVAPRALQVRLLPPPPNILGIAQPGQSPRFGTGKSLVQIQLPRPINGECRLMRKPHAVTVVHAGSSPVVHPTLAGVCYPRINRRKAALIQFLADMVQRWNAALPAQKCGLDSRCPRQSTVREWRRGRLHKPPCAGSIPALTTTNR